MNTNKTEAAIMALFTFIETMIGALVGSYLFAFITKQPFEFNDPLLLITSGIIAIIPAVAVFLKTNVTDAHHTAK